MQWPLLSLLTQVCSRATSLPGVGQAACQLVNKEKQDGPLELDGSQFRTRC